MTFSSLVEIMLFLVEMEMILSLLIPEVVTLLLVGLGLILSGLLLLQNQTELILSPTLN